MIYFLYLIEKFSLIINLYKYYQKKNEFIKNSITAYNLTKN